MKNIGQGEPPQDLPPVLGVAKTEVKVLSYSKLLNF